MTGIRLGVLGGTFNPIHNGHLHIAEQVQKLFSLEQIHFVVAATPPHKSPERVTALNHRYAMVCLATCHAADFIPSLVELEPPASPFSVDTLAKLRGPAVNGDQVYFIAGTDSLVEVSSWHDSETLLTTNNFIFVSRPGVKLPDPGSLLPAAAVSRVRDLRGMDLRQVRKMLASERYSNGIFLIDMDAPDISASRIRVLVSAGRPIRQLVPGFVRDYIRKLHLYGEE